MSSTSRSKQQLKSLFLTLLLLYINNLECFSKAKLDRQYFHLFYWRRYSSHVQSRLKKQRAIHFLLAPVWKTKYFRISVPSGFQTEWRSSYFFFISIRTFWSSRRSRCPLIRWIMPMSSHISYSISLQMLWLRRSQRAENQNFSLENSHRLLISFCYRPRLSTI